MAIDNNIWQYIEKLYIHCYKVVGFIEFLKLHGVDIKEDFYSNFEIYTFMSKERYEFIQIMQSVPTYKYLPILKDIIFDSNIQATQNDNWNYYGVFIKHWYPKLKDFLIQSGVQIDETSKTLKYEEQNLGVGNERDFLRYPFNDPFLDYIRKEINECFNNEQFLATLVLSRKMAECIIVRVFEIVFPKIDNGTYKEENHFLWYNKEKNRYHDFNYLLEKLKEHSAKFQEDKDLVETIYSLTMPFKNEMNCTVHYDYKRPTKEQIEKISVPNIIDHLRKIYIKYCNH